MTDFGITIISVAMNYLSIKQLVICVMDICHIMARAESKKKECTPAVLWNLLEICLKFPRQLLNPEMGVSSSWPIEAPLFFCICYNFKFEIMQRGGIHRSKNNISSCFYAQVAFLWSGSIIMWFRFLNSFQHLCMWCTIVLQTRYVDNQFGSITFGSITFVLKEDNWFS